MEITGKYILSSNGMLGLFVLGFSVIDFLMVKFGHKIKFLKKREKYRILYSLAATIILGAIFLIVTGNNLFEMVSRIFNQIVRSRGTSRVGGTVAENRAPFLNDWFGQMRKIFFWLFIGGMIFIGKQIV